MRLLLLCFPALFLVALLGTQPPGIREYANRITPAELKAKVSILASDSVGGRETGTRGQRIAAAFIRSHFEMIGLTGPAEDGFFQPIDLYLSAPGDTYVKSGNKMFNHAAEVMYYGGVDSRGGAT